MGRPRLSHLPPLTRAVCVATLSGAHFTVSEIAAYAGVPEPQAAAYLRTLINEQVVDRVAAGTWSAGANARAWRTSRPGDSRGGNSIQCQRERAQAQAWAQRAWLSRTGKSGQDGNDLAMSKTVTPKTNESPPCVGIPSAARRTATPMRTLRHWCASGAIQGAVRLGRTWRIPSAWVEQVARVGAA